MKFPNVIGRRELMNAAVIGSVSGLAGVVFFIFLLSSMTPTTDTQQAGTNPEQEMIPVQSSEGAVKDESSVGFFANQYGVFKSNESALDFISEYPSLNTSAVVEVDGKFYVWSAVSPIREELILSSVPTSFAKSFTFSAAACTQEMEKTIPKLLQSNDPSKYYFQDGNVPENVPQDWHSITSAISGFSQDLGIARLHLLAHYFTKSECMKIEF